MAITPGTITASSGNLTTSLTLVINAGVVAGQILVLAAVNRDGTADPSVTDNDAGGNAWAKIGNQNANTNGAVSAWWKRATSGTAGKTITVSGMTGSCAAGVVPMAGASIGADPFANTTVIGEANASGNETQAQITTARPGSMVFLVVGCTSNDTLAVTTQAATDPSSLAEQFEGVSSGGSDCSVALACAIKNTAGATGAFTWAQTNGTGASLAFALLPAIDALDAVAGSCAVTGTAASLEFGRKVAADAGSVGVTGQDATLTYTPFSGYTLDADAGAIAVTGAAASLARGLEVAADGDAFAVTGTAAGLLTARLISADGEAMVTAGADAGLLAARELPAGTGSLALSGQTAGLEFVRMLSASGGSVAVAGQDAALTYGGSLNHYSLTADAGAIAVTGAAADLVAARQLEAGSGASAITGAAAELLAARQLAAATESIQVAGQPADLDYQSGNVLAAGPGAYAVTGSSADFAAGRVLAAAAGSLVITGRRAAVRRVRRLPTPSTGGGPGARGLMSSFMETGIVRNR